MAAKPCQALLRHLPGDGPAAARTGGLAPPGRRGVFGPQLPTAGLAVSAVGACKIKAPFVSRFCIERRTCQWQRLATLSSHTHTHTTHMNAYAHTHACMHTHVHVHERIHTCMQPYIRTQIHKLTHMHPTRMRAHTYTVAHTTHMRTCMLMHMHVYTHACMHTHAHVDSHTHPGSALASGSLPPASPEAMLGAGAGEQMKITPPEPGGRGLERSP